jgi:transcriptional regulator with XRE-family HTH domain
MQSKTMAEQLAERFKREALAQAPPEREKSERSRVLDSVELQRWGSIEIGLALRRLRTGSHLSRRELGEMANISESMIVKIENGTRGPGANTLARMIVVIHEYTERMRPDQLVKVFELVARFCDEIARSQTDRYHAVKWRGHERFHRERLVAEIAGRNG